MDVHLDMVVDLAMDVDLAVETDFAMNLNWICMETFPWLLPWPWKWTCPYTCMRAVFLPIDRLSESTSSSILPAAKDHRAWQGFRNI